MQPTAQTSIDCGAWHKDLKRTARGTSSTRTLVYILNDSMISGARYHLVATYSVIIPALPPLCAPDAFTILARPKSHTFRSQLAFTRRLAGFRSRWTMPALWMDLRARRVW